FKAMKCWTPKFPTPDNQGVEYQNTGHPITKKC
ncbi:MAG: hypothetical protein ACI8W7_000509, partial [Gammaproteobacteria bacterium]